MIEEARKERAKTLEGARREALDLVASAGKDTKKFREHELKVVEEELGEKRRELDKKLQKEVSELKAGAKKRVPASTKFVLSAFEEEVGKC